jgi:CMP-N,N'-diacetyllegionaminic acid synthase
MDIICVIPARSNSKTIPNKNLIKFNGKPLIAWTIEAAIKTKKFSRIIVSTDSKKIEKVARNLGAEVPFLRPKKLSGDNIHATEATLHTIKWLSLNENYFPKYTMMLLPTSPLRKSKHISGAINLLKKTKASSVIGVLDSGKYIENLRYMKNGYLIKLKRNIKLNVQRQRLRPIYSVNGAIFIAKTKKLVKTKTYHINDGIGYEMDFLSSIDVNSFRDLNIAKDFNLILDLKK